MPPKKKRTQQKEDKDLKNQNGVNQKKDVVSQQIDQASTVNNKTKISNQQVSKNENQVEQQKQENVKREQNQELQKLKLRIQKFGANPNSDLQKLNAFRVMNLNKAPKQLQQKAVTQESKKFQKIYLLQGQNQQTIKNRMQKFGMRNEQKDFQNPNEQDVYLDNQIQKSTHTKSIQKTFKNKHEAHHKHYKSKHNNDDRNYNKEKFYRNKK